MRTYAFLTPAAAGITGCASGPGYVRPDADTPAAWRIDDTQAAGVGETKWWEQFGDPVLDTVVESALREFAHLSTLRFDKGVADYLDVRGARTSCSRPNWARCACWLIATCRWSTWTRRWVAAGSISPARLRRSRRIPVAPRL